MCRLSTLRTFFVLFAVVKVLSGKEDDVQCPRRESSPGVVVVKLGSKVEFGCRGELTVDGVPLSLASVMSKNNRHHQREMIHVSQKMLRRKDASSTQLQRVHFTRSNQSTDTDFNPKNKIGPVVPVNPSRIKWQSTSGYVFVDINQTEQVMKVFGKSTRKDRYVENRPSLTQPIQNQARWTFNGRHIHAGVERGGVLMRAPFIWEDAGSYRCYRGDRLVSTFQISIGVPPERPSLNCYRKFHTSKVRCDWTAKQPITPRPLCYMILNRGHNGNISQVPCSFSRSRCWCTFPAEEGNRALHLAKLCVTNSAGNFTSPVLSFKLHNIIQPDPPSRLVVRAVEGQKHMLKVSWIYPSSWKTGYYVLQFHLRYKPLLSQQYQSVMIPEQLERRLSWVIYDALPHTLYEVQLQAKDEFDGVWSDWAHPVIAVTWSAPVTTTASVSINFEPDDLSEGSGGSENDSSVGSVLSDDDSESTPAWMYASGVLGLCSFLVLTLLTIYFLGRVSLVRVKRTLPFTSVLHSSPPASPPPESEQPTEEEKPLTISSMLSQEQYSQQEAIHLHNKDYFQCPGAEDVPG